LANDSQPRDRLILVVDDEPTVLRSVTTALAMDGFRVMVAENGVAGLEAFLVAPDEIVLVLADVVMPVMNGLEMADKIRALRPATRILLMTGYSDAVILTLSQPALPLIRKPFLPDDLIRAIHRILDLNSPAGAT
jgi:DNA-binding NtrC family response regulator